MKTSTRADPSRLIRALAAIVVAFIAEQLPAAEPRTVSDLEITLMPIPAGTFTMGRVGSFDFDGPPTEVTISKPFWLGRTEVTQGQWKAVMRTDVLEQVRRQLADDQRAGKQLSRRDGVSRDNVTDPRELVYNIADDVPMYWVSWEEAVEFCRRLTERERAAGRLPAGYEYRLPTAAEWEYAARAGMDATTRLAIKYLDQTAWYGGRINTRIATTPTKFPYAAEGPHTVATKLPNEWGLHDMFGNVWEWCRDWYSVSLPGGSVTDPAGAASGAVTAAGGPGRVIRGGGWPTAAHVIDSAMRIWQLPGQRESALGFRVALAPDLQRLPSLRTRAAR